MDITINIFTWIVTLFKSSSFYHCLSFGFADFNWSSFNWFCLQIFVWNVKVHTFYIQFAFYSTAVAFVASAKLDWIHCRYLVVVVVVLRATAVKSAVVVAQQPANHTATANSTVVSFFFLSISQICSACFRRFFIVFLHFSQAGLSRETHLKLHNAFVRKKN